MQSEPHISPDLGFVHRWLPGADSETTLLLLHGTGGNENDLIPLGHALAPGASLLGVRGKVLENGMPRFFRRLSEGVFDEEDLRRRTDELVTFLHAAAARYGFPVDSVVAVGYSNGANIAASALLLHPGELRRAILLRAMLPVARPEPVDNSATAVLISAGLHDPIVPRDQPGDLAAVLRAGGADVTLRWQEAGHELGDADLRDARAWLSSVTGTPAAS